MLLINHTNIAKLLIDIQCTSLYSRLPLQSDKIMKQISRFIGKLFQNEVTLQYSKCMVPTSSE